jgi:hypothetical protein
MTRFKIGDVVVFTKEHAEKIAINDHTIELIVDVAETMYVGFNPRYNYGIANLNFAITDAEYSLVTDQNIINDIKHRYKICQLTDIIEK